MTQGGGADNFSMLDLFRTEIEGQVSTLIDSLLVLEQDPKAQDQLEILMRASHSIKGAARMVEVDMIVTISHVMEDCFVAAQKEEVVFSSEDIDLLLTGVDMIARVTKENVDDDYNSWAKKHEHEIDGLVDSLSLILSNETHAGASLEGKVETSEQESSKYITNHTQAESKEEHPVGNNIFPSAQKDNVSITDSMQTEAPDDPSDDSDDHKSQDKSGDKSSTVKARIVKVSSDRMDRLLGLASEVVVESRWLRQYLNSMMLHKRFHNQLVGDLDKLRELQDEVGTQVESGYILHELQRSALENRRKFTENLVDLEQFDYRSSNLAGRLHREVIASRMRPFSDGVDALQRMVRDVARSIGKKVKLEITGLSTQVDRDVLEMVKAPLNHLLRNAVDHGIETAQEREISGKPSQAIIRLDARHRAGMLVVTVEDDGRGMDLEKLKQKIVEKGLSAKSMLDKMSDSELLDFLFLPGFSTRTEVTELSGRGVGLDVVHDTVKEMRGVVSVSTRLGKGSCFNMQLPLTLSVIRTLLVDIGGECFAFPLARIDHLLTVSKEQVDLLEGRQFITWNNQHIGLLAAAQLFGMEQQSEKESFSVVVVSDRHNQYGIVVDSFFGERELAVQVLDPRLGKVKDISVAALLDDGSPTLIVDVDDLVRSIDNLISGGRMDGLIDATGLHKENREKKRILVVDDSITVREVERNMLNTYGYNVDVAVDGMDGWNSIRTGNYQLIITDVDMPRMDGIELVKLIKADSSLKDMPVMIVSYKESEEDRWRGLDAGADYYLTKGSFHDETLHEAVIDLIGEP